jgi:DNA-binding transcriptional LysR family regulator
MATDLHLPQPTARRDRGVTLSGLRTFVAVVQARGLSGAARALGVTQPSVSVQLAALERACGVLLCHRKPEFALTEAGADVFVRARLILSRVDEFESALDHLQQAAGRVSVGLSTPHVAMPLLASFRAAHPGISLQVSMGNTSTLLEDVARCRVDVGVMTLREPPPHLLCLKVASPRLAVCLRADDPLARRRSLRPADVAALEIIAREPGSQTRALFDDTLARAGVTPRVVMEVGNRAAMREAVAAGLGVGMLFDNENGDDRRFALVPLQGVPQAPGVYAVALNESLGIPGVQALIEHLRLGAGRSLSPGSRVRG